MENVDLFFYQELYGIIGEYIEITPKERHQCLKDLETAQSEIRINHLKCLFELQMKINYHENTVYVEKAEFYQETLLKVSIFAFALWKRYLTEQFRIYRETVTKTPYHPKACVCYKQNIIPFDEWEDEIYIKNS